MRERIINKAERVNSSISNNNNNNKCVKKRKKERKKKILWKFLSLVQNKQTQQI
jgi:hypothetical protein